MMWPETFLCTLLLLALSPPSHHGQSAAPAICTELHNATIHDPQHDGFSIQNQPGDATVSLLTNEPIPLHNINLAGLNEALTNDAHTLGLRILYVASSGGEADTVSALHDLLLREVQYQQQCTKEPIAILVLHEMWPLVADIVEDIDYNIWRLPPASRLLYPKVAHILYELPWNATGDGRPATLSVHGVDVLAEEAFVEAARGEHLCLTAARRVAANAGQSGGMQIVLGRTMLSDGQYDQRLVTTVAVPTILDDYMNIANLSIGSFVVTETDHSARVTVILAITAVLSQLTKLLHACNTTDATITLLNDTHPDPFDAELPCRHPVFWNLDTVSTLSAHDMYAEIVWATLAIDPTVVLRRKFASSAPAALFESEFGQQHHHDLRHIATINVLTNVTTFYNYSDWPSPTAADGNATATVGAQFLCENATARETTVNIFNIYTAADYSQELYWRIRPDIWVACGLTLALLGILISFAIFVFVLVRLYMEDVLEGNPVGTIALLIALIALFASFVPFCLEYTSDRHQVDATLGAPDTPIGLCAVRLVLVMLGYCFPFALLLCRTIMLASIGSEGGFLSHVNGYIQSVIFVFSVLVQVGMCVQLVVLVIGYQETVSCDTFYYGPWFWALLGYDGFLLVLMLVLAPFCVRSQRNYKEGVLMLIGAMLCVAVWSTWIPLATVDREWRDAAIALGMQATGWAILGAILVPRSFLIVRGIARADMAQALPSLASLAFAHNLQCMSEQSIYECVNPAMRQQAQQHGGNAHHVAAVVGGNHNGGMVPGHEDDYGSYEYSERCPSPSEIPTLPLRGASRKARNMVEYASSQQSTMPASPNKATRF